uniref:Senescence-associated protein n=1 Tax=Salix viminalis TaxID=40686 RepID=A0A6N2L052_SALVM
MFEEKKHLQLIHERSTALNGTNNHQSPSSKPRVRAMLEPMTFLNQYTVPNSVTAESSWHCLRCHHGEIAAMIKTRSNPLSKPRAHAMTCMNQKRAAEFTGIAFAAETADTAESAAIALFDPVTAGLYSRRATARAPPSPRVPGPGNSRPSLREAVLLEGLGGTNRSDMGLNLSGSWQQGHSATYNTPSRGPRGSSTARAWPTARASGAKRPLLQVGNRTAGARVASSPDSDLEAFSHNPTHAHVPYWWVNNPTLGEFCFTMIGRADIEGSKSNVAMNAWLPQASYPCGNFSDTSSFKFRRSKGSIGHAFTVRIRTGNQNQTSFYPFVPHEISVLVELILGHLRYLLTDVPPQPNSPPDNVFRPDRPPKRPWVQKEGQRPASDSRNNRIPLVRTSSESTVRRPGKAPERAVPSPSPGRHATTRSRRGSSSSSPPTADGFGTGTPEPSPQSQSFSRGYGSILPTSLAYIVPSTRGCSPWRPDAVMSTTGRGRHSVLRIFKGRRGRTGHHATCGALPAAGPYLRLSRFQEKITLPEAPADVSGLPNVAVSRHVPDRLTHVQVPFTWNLSPLRPSNDRRALLLIGAWRLPRRPGIGRALQRHPFSGLVDSAGELVSAQLGTVTRFRFIPHRQFLLTKCHWSSRFRAALNEAAAPSYYLKFENRSRRCAPEPLSLALPDRTAPSSSYPEGNLRRNQLLDGIVHHFRPDRHALHSTLSEDKLLGPCFNDGRMGSPQADARSAHVPGTPVTARAAVQDRSDASPQASKAAAATAIRIGPRPEPIGGPAPYRLFHRSSPPGRYLGLHSQNNPTRDRSSCAPVHHDGLSPLPAPFRGVGPGPKPRENSSPDYIRNAAGPVLKLGHFPRVVPADLGRNESILESQCSGSGKGLLNHRSSWQTAAEDSILGQPRAGARGDQFGRGLGRNLRSKTRWFTGSAFTPSIAISYVLHRCESRDNPLPRVVQIITKRRRAPDHEATEGGLLVLNFLGASRAPGFVGEPCRAQMRPSTARVDTRGGCPRAQLVMPRVRGSFCGAGFDNDSFRRFTYETLLRLRPSHEGLLATTANPSAATFTGPFKR